MYRRYFKVLEHYEFKVLDLVLLIVSKYRTYIKYFNVLGYGYS